MSKSKVIVVTLLILACISAGFYYYFSHSIRVAIFGDASVEELMETTYDSSYMSYKDYQKRPILERNKAISNMVMMYSVYLIFIVLMVTGRWFKKINNWVLANLMLILPSAIRWIGSYAYGPHLFTLSSAIFDLSSIYIYCNVIALLIFIGKKAGKRVNAKTA